MVEIKTQTPLPVKPPRTVYLWNKVDEQSIKKDAQDFANEFLDSKPEDLTKHVPNKQVKGHQRPPWFTQNHKRLCRKKGRYYLKAVEHNDQKHWDKFKTIRKEVDKELRKASREYVADLSAAEDTKKFWNYIRSRRKDNVGIQTLKIGNETFVDDQSKADKLADQFQSVFSIEDPNLPSLPTSPYPDIPDIEITVDGVEKLLSSLQTNKAVGYFVTEGEESSIGLVISNVDAAVLPSVSIAFTATPASAIATDYTVASSPVDVTVPAGVILVETITDDVNEGCEAFQICIDPPTSPTDYKLDTPSDVTVWICDAADMTTVPESEYCLDGTVYTVMESSSAVNIKICRKGDVSQEGSVVLTTSNVDAKAANDYSIVNQRVSFTPNELCKIQEVAIVDDELLEPTECFQVSLSQPIGGLLCTHNSATVNIKDDDYCFSLDNWYYSAPESDEPFIIGVVKWGFYGDPSIVVTFQTNEGSAEENVDFTSVMVSLEFQADKRVMYVPLTVNPDGEYETREQFTVRISAADPSRICEPSTATVVIVSSDSLQTTCEGGTCPNSYCLNGGSCINRDNYCECQCSVVFEGLRCETRVTTGMLILFC
ncbi:uncharacterized protein [Amphiura filiformis]|uniref:uncharacterized protein n=1 Tax=Amphiura filiformis TaxID=82378 RepID=UPI003B2200C6